MEVHMIRLILVGGFVILFLILSMQVIAWRFI